MATKFTFTKENIEKLQFIEGQLSKSGKPLTNLEYWDENIWQAKMNPLRRTYNNCVGRQVYVQRKSSLDARLVDLIDSLLDEECADEPFNASANE